MFKRLDCIQIAPNGTKLSAGICVMWSGLPAEPVDLVHLRGSRMGDLAKQDLPIERLVLDQV